MTVTGLRDDCKQCAVYGQRRVWRCQRWSQFRLVVLNCWCVRYYTIDCYDSTAWVCVVLFQRFARLGTAYAHRALSLSCALSALLAHTRAITPMIRARSVLLAWSLKTRGRPAQTIAPSVSSTSTHSLVTEHNYVYLNIKSGPLWLMLVKFSFAVMCWQWISITVHVRQTVHNYTYMCMYILCHLRLALNENIGLLAVWFSSADCPAGTFRSGDVCTDCPYDEYQDEIRKETCDPCGQSQITLQIGSTLEEQCRELLKYNFLSRFPKQNYYEAGHALLANFDCTAQETTKTNKM